MTKGLSKVTRQPSLPATVLADKVMGLLRNAEKALQQATTIHEHKLVADFAKAQEVLIHRQKLGDDLKGYAHSIHIIALARLGDLIQEAKKAGHFQGAAGKAGPGRGNKKTPSTRGGVLYDIVDEKTAAVAQQLAALPSVTRQEIAAREKTFAQARRERHEAENRRTLTTQVVVRSQALGIHHGDFRTLAPTLIPDDSAQLVFTDPPYDEKSVDLFEAAAKEAARVLVPGGSFIAYSGQKYLAQAIQACSKHLTYWWLFALIHDGPAQLLQKLGVRCQWKPIVWFVKNTRGDVTLIMPDLVHGSGREKDQHEWQQGEAEAATLIERLTKPNDLVIDFMAGGGTIPAAAKRLDRRIVAFESQAANVEKITRRIA